MVGVSTMFSTAEPRARATLCNNGDDLISAPNSAATAIDLLTLADLLLQSENAFPPIS